MVALVQHDEVHPVLTAMLSNRYSNNDLFTSSLSIGDFQVGPCNHLIAFVSLEYHCPGKKSFTFQLQHKYLINPAFKTVVGVVRLAQKSRTLQSDEVERR